MTELSIVDGFDGFFVSAAGTLENAKAGAGISADIWPYLYAVYADPGPSPTGPEGPRRYCLIWLDVRTVPVTVTGRVAMWLPSDSPAAGSKAVVPGDLSPPSFLSAPFGLDELIGDPTMNPPGSDPAQVAINVAKIRTLDLRQMVASENIRALGKLPNGADGETGEVFGITLYSAGNAPDIFIRLNTGVPGSKSPFFSSLSIYTQIGFDGSGPVVSNPIWGIMTLQNVDGNGNPVKTLFDYVAGKCNPSPIPYWNSLHV
jgi:hypothetical protein